MAMEIKTLDVSNEKEQETIQFWMQFGWNLKSSQRVYNKDSHLEARGDSTYSVTETVDYTRLVFERDKNGPNYQRLVTLEQEYFNLLQTIPDKRPSRPFVDHAYRNAEEWVKSDKPNLSSTLQRAILAGGLIAGIILFSLLYDHQPKGSAGANLCMLGVTVVVIGFFVLRSIFKRRAIAGVLSGTNAKAKARMETLYKEYQKKRAAQMRAVKEYEKEAEEYDRKMERMGQILAELDTLI